MDLFDDVFCIEEEEALKRKGLSAKLFKNMHHRNSKLAQKVKIRWLKKGDINSKFFHKAIKFSTKKNEVVRLNIA